MTSVFKHCDVENQLHEAERLLTARVVKINGKIILIYEVYKFLCMK